MLNTRNPKIEESLTLFSRVDASPAYLSGHGCFHADKALGFFASKHGGLSMRQAAIEKEPSNMSKKRTARSRRNEPRIYRTPPHPLAWAIVGNHVYPINDLRKHSLHDCWCDPVDDDGVIVHRSLDGREEFQNGERKPS